MTKKWKDFATLTAFTVPAVVGEIGWSALLTWGSSRIPYVGVPLAIFIGSAGTIGAVWVSAACRSAYKDWYKEYHTK